MDQLPNFGRGIEEVLLPTFGAYETLLKAQESDIRRVQRETHTYGPDARHVLDVYFPPTPSPSPFPSSEQQTQTQKQRKTVLVFLHGGGFYAGARVNEEYAGGLIFGNLGRFFTEKFGATVVVPDYRLIAHGAKYPSGGEDVGLVVEWVRTALARGGGGVDLVLMGNSAGGVHVATFLLDEAFAGVRDGFIGAGAGAGDVRLRGVVFLGAPFHWGDVHDHAIRAYMGEETVFANSPLGKLQVAVREGGAAARLRDVKVLILVSEFDPPFLFETAEEFTRLWPGGEIETQVLKGHNHISPQLSLGTGVEREEAWGVQVAEFLSSCAGS